VARERWTIESGLLTPSMKLKRAVVEAHYRPFLEDWYGRGQKVIWQE
jgi:long-subunit acyl-CoA synthetase (AMP-forming)